MKKTVLFLASLISVTAVARSIKMDVVSATIVKRQIDPNSYLASEKLGMGSISINKTKKTVTLMFERAHHRCPPGRFCKMDMPAPLIIELPIVSVENSHCDSVVYTAQIDKRPADGNFEELKITDNSRFYQHCRTGRAVDPTYVKYTTISSGFTGHRVPKVVKTESRFIGEKLKQQ